MSLAKDFIISPSPIELFKFKKDDLLEIGKELELDVKRAMRKAQLLRIITVHFVENEEFPETVLDKLEPDTLETSALQFDLEEKNAS